MNFLQQKSSGGTQVSGLLAHVTVVKVWGSGVSSASGMLNMCLTCQLLWITVNAWLPQWYSYFFYPSHSSTNSTTSLWPRRYQLGSKVKKDTYIYLDFIWWAHFYGSLRGKKAVIWEHVRVSSPITRRDICQSGQLCWSVYQPWLQQVDWHLPVIWCTNGVLPLHSPPFRTLSIDRKIGVSQSICQGCMLCFSLSGLWQIHSVQADWKFKPWLCVCHAGGILVLVCHWLSDYVMCTVLQFVSILGVIFLQDWITCYKTITVGCHEIKSFHTFFAACQNQAVNNTAPPPIWTFPHILKDMETRRHGGEDVLYTIWVSHWGGTCSWGVSTCFHSFKSIFLVAFGCILSCVHDNSEQWIGNKM